MRRDIQQIADEEQRTITQICEMLLNEGGEAHQKEGSEFMQHLVAKQKAGVKDSNLATGGVLHVAGAPIRSFFRRLVRHRAGTMSVFLKSFPLKRRGSPVSLARA